MGNLNQLHLNRAQPLFLQGSGEDDSGELSQDEFFDKLSPFLGPRISRDDVAQTFMKIDADCGGTVNWCDLLRCSSGPALVATQLPDLP